MEIHSNLYVDRGPLGGNMTTLSTELETRKNQPYVIGESGVERAKSGVYAIDLEERAAHPSKVAIPPYAEVSAKWDKKANHGGSGNNILGDNGTLSFENSTIDIPVIDAGEETLAYYGATLLQKGDTVRFPDDGFPLFRMEVGPNYVRDFIMSEKGGGFYLEYHDDQPHFHMTLKNGGGYYILAKWNDDQTKLRITGFRIPEGSAVYTKKGAIHCDAALTGDLLVGYTSAEHCSTVLLRDKRGEMVDLLFGFPDLRRKFWSVFS